MAIITLFRIAYALYSQLNKLRLTESNAEIIEWSRDEVDQVLDIIENIWLKDRKFLLGNNLTMTDIFAAFEIEQSRISEFSPWWEGRPKLRQWYRTVRGATSPFYDRAHKILNTIVERSRKTKSKL